MDPGLQRRKDQFAMNRLVFTMDGTTPSQVDRRVDGASVLSGLPATVGIKVRGPDDGSSFATVDEEAHPSLMAAAGGLDGHFYAAWGDLDRFCLRLGTELRPHELLAFLLRWCVWYSHGYAFGEHVSGSHWVQVAARQLMFQPTVPHLYGPLDVTDMGPRRVGPKVGRLVVEEGGDLGGWARVDCL